MRARYRGLLLALLLGTTPCLAAALLPNGEQTFVDSNGQPYAGGSVYFYIPSTLTAKTTWSNPTQTTANPNPVVLDSAGRAIIYGSGAYRQVLKDIFGNTIWDQLTNGNSSGTSGINAPTITTGGTIGDCSGTFVISNATAAPITLTMPTSPLDQDSCAFADVGNNASSYPITLAFGSNTLTSGQSNFVLNHNTQVISFVWSATLNKWIVQ